MIEQAKKDVIAVLKDARSAIQQKLFGNLHGLSDHVIHTMSIYQDKDVIDVAVAVYALHKILSKERYIKYKQIKGFTKIILKLLKQAIKDLEKGDENAYRKVMIHILANIHGFDRKINVYIEDVLEFARVKKGSRMYEHGISLGQAAAAAGVTKWELMPVAGATITHEEFVEPIEKKRIELLKKLFKVRGL